MTSPAPIEFFKSLFIGQTAPLAFLAFSLPICSILGGRMIPFVIFGPFVLWYILRKRQSFKPFATFLRSPLLYLGGGLIAWGWCSVAWSIMPDASSSTMSRVGTLILLGLAAIRLATLHPPSALCAYDIRRALRVGMAIAFALVISALLLNGGLPALLNHALSTGEEFTLIKLKQGNLILAILVWPLVVSLLLDNRKKAAHGAIAIAIATLAFMPSSTALVSVSTGAVAYAVCRSLKPLHSMAFVSAAIIGAILVIFIAVPRLDVPSVYNTARVSSVSMLHRLYIWQFSIEKIHDKPLQGWGVKASDDIPDSKVVTPLKRGLVKLPLHPHNNLLQSWLEMGFVGFALYLGLVAYAIKNISHIPTPDIRAAAYATLIAALTGGFAGYGLWQSWWVDANLLIAVLVVALLPSTERRQGAGEFSELDNA